MVLGFGTGLGFGLSASVKAWVFRSDSGEVGGDAGNLLQDLGGSVSAACTVVLPYVSTLTDDTGILTGLILLLMSPA